MKDQSFCYLIKSQLYVRKYLLPSWFQMHNGNANRKRILDYSCEGLCRFSSPHSDVLSFQKNQYGLFIYQYNCTYDFCIPGFLSLSKSILYNISFWIKKLKKYIINKYKSYIIPYIFFIQYFFYLIFPKGCFLCVYMPV